MRRHGDDVGLVWLCAIRDGNAAAVAHMLVSLVESGGLALACTVKAHVITLGGFLAAHPCFELERCLPCHNRGHLLVSFA